MLGEGNFSTSDLENRLATQQRLADLQARFLHSQAELAIALVKLKQATGELMRNDDAWRNEFQVASCPDPAVSALAPIAVDELQDDNQFQPPIPGGFKLNLPTAERTAGETRDDSPEGSWR